MQNLTSPPQREPIAIVGIGCRFPGRSNSPEQFWQLLTAGRDVITEVPETRWSKTDYFDEDSLEPGKTYSKWGGFIEDIDKFDAKFFKISPLEARRIDPQHRLLLEVSWEALEDAGLAPERLKGSDTGVFMGLMTHDYGDLQAASEQLDEANAYVIGGSILSLASNRISHVFDFCGPSLTTDTACSSSLTAVHLACQSLWSGETQLALAGGASLLLSPHMMVVIAKARLLSGDGRCKSFDASADGYVRAEGAGVVALKRLSEAQRDGDRIYATIDATVMSQDGQKLGIGAPKLSSQAQLFGRACQQAQVDPNAVNYVEAHGTGTLAGDPIEANAVGQVFGQREAGQPDCVMGSVKSNMGHLEAASGVAGLVKTALCLYHRQIPASLHFKTPNPDIAFDQYRLRIPQELEAFPANAAGQYRAGLNSFGFGGTNVHVILSAQPDGESAQAAMQPDGQPEDEQTSYLVPVSAHTPIALKTFIQDLITQLHTPSTPPIALPDIAHNLSTRREHHGARAAFVTPSIEDLTNQLQNFLVHHADYLAQKKAIAPQPPPLVFVCSGMAQQTCGTARALLAQDPAFADAVQRIDAIFQPLANWSILTELAQGQDQERWNQVAVAQPLTFAIQVGLAHLLAAHGIHPAAVIGHSAGEVSAACIAGALSLEDATRLVFHRSHLQQTAAGSGKMLVVGLGQDQVELLLVGYQNRVEIAAINSSRSLTLSGETAAIEQIAQVLEQKDIFVRFLPGTIAYHSQAMAELQQPILDCLATIQPQSPTVPMISTVTGEPILADTINAQYWAQNLREVVNFQAGVEYLLNNDYRTFLELSSHPVLKSPLHYCAQERGTDLGQEIRYISTLHRKVEEQAAVLQTLSQLYTMGAALAWQQLSPAGRFWNFPRYPWQKKTYWYQEELAYTKPQSEPAAIAEPPLIQASEPAVSGPARSMNASPPQPPETVYHSHWLKARPAQQMLTAPRNWLLISRHGALAERLSDALSQDFQQTVFAVDAQAPEALQTLLQSHPEWAEQGIALNLVYVSEAASLDANPSDQALLQQAIAPCTELVADLHALQQYKHVTLQKIYLLTDRAQVIGPNSAAQGLAQSVLSGLGRVIANELPDSHCSCLDLDYADMPEHLPQVVRELLADHQEQEMVLRKGHKYLNVVEPAAALLPPEPSLHLRPESTYLVIGGFGGFGLAIAQWLAEQGCRSLVLAGRTVPADMDALPEVQAMRAIGAIVTPLSCDVSQAEQVTQLLTQIEQSLPPLRGIVHSAMVLNDASLANLSPDHFQRVFAPKVVGAWNLHQQSQRYSLDHFVLCSSVSAILGTPGQGNYAAANAFLDALAQERHRLGLPALSLNWGLLADVGYVIRKQKQEMFAPLERVGWIKLPCQTALTVLGQAMNSTEPQVIVAPMDWQKWQRFHAVGQSFRFSQLGRNLDPNPPQPVLPTPIPVEAPTLNPETQRLTLERQIQAQVAQVFQMAIAEVELHQPLTDMGLDSLTAVELKTAITQQVGVDISLSSVLSGCTIAELTTQTWPQFQALSPPPTPAVAQVAPPPSNGLPARPVPQPPAKTGDKLNPEEQRLTLERQIQAQVAQVFQMAIAEVELHQPLTDMGLDSLTAVELKTAITQQVGVDISLSSVLSGCTIAELTAQTWPQFQALPQIQRTPAPAKTATKTPAPSAAPQPAQPQAAIASGHTQNSNSTITPPTSARNPPPGFTCLAPRPQPKLRLFCFPYAGGGPSVFKDWPQQLPETIEVYALQLPGRSKRLTEQPIRDMPNAVADMRQSIQPLLDVPAIFFGHCVGALQMFELTHQLQAHQQTLPIALFVSGARSPQFYTEAQFQVDVTQYSPLSPIPGHQLPEQAFLDMLEDLDFSTSQALFDDQELRNLLLPTVRADLELNNTYRYQTQTPLDLPIFAVGGRVDPYVTGEHILGWKKQTTQQFSAHFCPGNHYFIETQRSFLITQLLQALDSLNCRV